MTAEVIEGTAVEAETRALTVAPAQGMAAEGAMALAALSDEEFDRRLLALEKGRDRVARIQRALMVPDVDYGVIPGTGGKPTLLKPGAEKLCQAYGLAADFAPDRIVGDGEREPHLSYVTRCSLHLGSIDGPIVAIGYGSANSWERKHRYRRGERVCPDCGLPAIIKGKAEYGGGWVCFKKKGGCGSKWADGDPVIEQQVVGDIENVDPFDLDVVLAKMSEKRAYVDATLRATAASGLFTQDVEDLARPPEPPPADDRDAGGLIGTVTKGQAPVDFDLRYQPDGSPAAGFKLKQGSQGIQVLAVGPLADALAPFLPGLDGQTVTAWGAIVMVPWDKAGKTMPPYRRLMLTQLTTHDWTLPGPTAGATEPTETAEAESVPLFELTDEEKAAIGKGLPA